ncbi:nucleoside 2-deoxyribosyltransferase [Geomesophilobacter sediminis]|uniref:Nucleoside 2-deoxyribosyltransferase n=1 Tax=Geomesophilobacter sediminis TaxID=2798584 RepID=A0A8J7JEG0_9BACT|nr:nucleoside 2-deoxyribosyltransferase [Geomesophilobacter sediminis]MBJ6725993.1 nucleoside 2-deoxyribosyltransferase [Geomesophilobacter sediminis]
MKKLYLASPLGFSPENVAYLNKIKVRLAALGFEIFDPWDQTQFKDRIETALRQTDFNERVAQLQEVSRQIGTCNEGGIRWANYVLAVLDGAEVDSGTAGEVGFASALGKKCYGLRTDLRDSGDFVGLPINLQLIHFIERSGGKIFRSIDEIVILL